MLIPLNARLKKERANVEWAAIASKEGELAFSPSYLPALSSTLAKNEHNRAIRSLFKAAIRVPSLKLKTLLAKYNIGAIDLLDIRLPARVARQCASCGHCQFKLPRTFLLRKWEF